MKKLLFFCLVFPFFIQAQPLQTPASFLGYQIGKAFTPPYKVNTYFQYAANLMPSNITLQQYGKTYQGQSLLLAFVSSPKNLAKLEEIRLKNIAISKGLEKNTADIPVIVWLSYNVHGNEAASSEAAMLTLYALLDPNNVKTKEWLENTLVILDPCINPDGRNRYVQWYNNAIVNHKNNISPVAKEHFEPNPSGRTNAYYFDLNRDWAWQTQIESQQRIKVYNQWLPHIHVDYHEQGYNEPYYFAPAAEPMHENITNFQKNFQVKIGKNNAFYFDKNNWLYFTKERFDLLYPSYGDTYPTYKGSVGMTYEQGGISAGLGVITQAGDTLTLIDRAEHHHTTGLSTIEISSKNKTEILDNFIKFYDNNLQGNISEYKTFILTSSNANSINEIAELLKKNDIEFGVIQNKNFKGFRYFTNKEESYTDLGFHLAVSMNQSQSLLAKILLEQKTFVKDSNTYDITAWSIPYNYNVECYATKEKMVVSPNLNATKVNNELSNFGYVIPYNSLTSAKLLSRLLLNNIKVRIAYQPFEIKNKKFSQGSLVVLKTSNGANWNTITQQICNAFNIVATPVESGFVDAGADFGSPNYAIISSQPKVAILTTERSNNNAVGEVWHLFEQELQYPITIITTQSLNRIEIKDFDVIIMPDGNYNLKADKNVADKIKTFIKNGGNIIALENAVSEFKGDEFGLKLIENKKDEKASTSNIVAFGDEEKDYIKNSIPGAIYKLKIDNTHPIGFGFNNTYYTLKQDENIYEISKEMYNVGVIQKDGYIAGFAGFNVKKHLENEGTLIGEINHGKGKLIFFNDDPIFRNFWNAGKLLLLNAVFLRN